MSTILLYFIISNSMSSLHYYWVILLIIISASRYFLFYCYFEVLVHCIALWMRGVFASVAWLQHLDRVQWLPEVNIVLVPVSYTHLDVYKRQTQRFTFGWVIKGGGSPLWAFSEVSLKVVSLKVRQRRWSQWEAIPDDANSRRPWVRRVEWAAIVNRKLARSLRSVSYTHLDVYKRQDIARST